MGIFVDTCGLRFLQEHLFARFGVGLLLQFVDRLDHLAIIAKLALQGGPQ
jgi:hypothetical protein